MEQKPEGKRPLEIYNEEVEPALNKLRLVYAILISDDNIINSDFANDIQQGIHSAVSEFMLDAVQAVNHFADAVFEERRVVDES